MGYKGSKILKKKFGKVAPSDSLKTFYTPDTPLIINKLRIKYN